MARNLKVRKPRIATGTAVGAAMGMGVALVAPFTFGTSLAVTAAVAGIGAPLGAGKSNLRLAEVQAAINNYCRACAELQGQLDSLNRTFTSTSSAGATPGAMVRTWLVPSHAHRVLLAFPFCRGI